MVGVFVVLDSPGGAPTDVAALAATGAELSNLLSPLVPVAAAAQPSTTNDALVAVSVAEVWGGRHKPRPVDHPAQQLPAQLGRWLGRMTIAQRLGLDSRLATQVRYGEHVVVLRRSGWLTRVRIPDQTGGRYPRGVTGWVASRQLQPEPAGWDSAKTVATVTATRTILHEGSGGQAHRLAISYATTLPVVNEGAHRVVVAVPGPAHFGTLRRSAVSVHASDKPAIHPSGRAVLRQARKFLGLPYLWAGMSAWGFDCSGLTSTVLSMVGVRLPRDAADQSRVGKPVRRRDLKPGDLVFFSYSRSRGAIHHVAVYAGHGRVLQSPYTGARVEVTRLRHSYLNREYWGATQPLS